MKKLFHEISEFDCRLEEQDGKGGTKRYIVSGPFTRADVPNRNNRIYPKAVIDKCVDKLRKRVTDGRVRMMLDHPGFLEGPSLSKASAQVLEITNVGPDGYAHYRAQIIDTTCGKDLKAIIDAGGKVGVSTRGYGTSKDEQEVPGFPGKYSIINDDYEMDTFDFVEDPSVMATEEYMQVENKRRQPMKTFAEIKAAYPDVIKEYEDQVAAEKKTLADQVADLTTKFESLQKTSTEKFNKLVSTIKESAPEAFVTVPETDVIKAKDEELKKVNETAAATAKSLSEATAKIQAFETEKTNLLKESEIKTIKGSDADFFKGEANKSIFDNCLNADEVRKVYTDRKALIDSIKKDNNTPAPTKSKDNTQVPAELTEEQKKDMDGRNRDRLRSGIPAMTVDQYKKEWVK